MKIIKKNWKLIILFVSVIAISSAFLAEYGFNILPCKMCINQRYPYYFLIFLSLIFLIRKKLDTKIFFFLTEVALLYGLFYSVWHVGIEQKLLSGREGCSMDLEKNVSLSDLKKQLLEQDIVSCDNINWSLLGISAATINTLVTLLLLTINTIFIININNEKKT